MAAPLSIRFPEALRARIDARAELERRKPSDLVRRAVEDYLDGVERPSEPAGRVPVNPKRRDRAGGHGGSGGATEAPRPGRGGKDLDPRLDPLAEARRQGGIGPGAGS